MARLKGTNMRRKEILTHLSALAGFSAISLVVATTSCVGVSARKSAKSSGDGGYFVKTCSGEIVTAGDVGLIDDFEDGNTQVLKREGRGGYWWRSQDPDGSKFENEESKPTSEGCSGSSLCLHHWGKTSNKPGAWGVNFGANVGLEGTADLSQYVGISFRAKSRSGVGHNVRFKISDINTHPNLGVCKTCWNHWGKDIQLTNDWREYRVLFAGVEQRPGWGDPRPVSIDPSRIYSIDWSIDAGTTFDIWVDDIQLLKCK
jgi:hypothetical protein